MWLYIKHHKYLLALVAAGLPVILGLEYLALSLLFQLSQNGIFKPDWLKWLLEQFSLGSERFDPRLAAIFFILLLFAIRIFVGFLHSIATFRLGRLLQRDINLSVYFNIIAGEDLSGVSKKGVGHYVNLAGEGASKSAQLFITFVRMLEGSLVVIVALVVLLNTSKVFSIAFLVFSVMAALFIYIELKRIYRIGELELSNSIKSSAVFIESVNNVQTIRSLGVIKYFLKKYQQLLGNVISLRLKIEINKAAQKSFPALFLIILGAVFINPWHPVVDELNPIIFVGLIIVTIRLMSALGGMVAAFGAIYSDWPVVREIKEVPLYLTQDLSKLPENNESMSGGVVVIVGLSYRYPGAGVPLFNDLNFKLECGKSYALLGPSGSGKSTFLDILSGNLNPDSGGIHINQSLQSAECLKHSVLVVEQNPKMFSMSIRDNLTLGQDYEDSKLWEVIDATKLTEFIKGLEFGLDTILDYQAVNISGGQFQRLAIARALLRRPFILALDESTTGLDEKTKSELLQNIKLQMRDGVLLCVTHDFQVVKMLDVQLMMQ